MPTISLTPVVTVQTGRPGRPRKVINRAYLRSAMSARRGLSISRLARLLGLHRHTVRNYLKRNKVDYGFSDVSDEDLDRLVRAYRKQKPESGIRYLVGFLRTNGLRVPITRIRASIARVDPVGHILC